MNPTFLPSKSKKELNELALDLISFLERCKTSQYRKLWCNHISFQAVSGASRLEVAICLKVLFSFLRTHKHKLSGVPGEWSVADNGNRYIDLLINDKVVRFTFYSRKCNPDFPAFDVKDTAYYGFTIDMDIPKTDNKGEKEKDE